MKEINISIIVPVNNLATEISKTVASILAQTFSNWELILINDGCDDQTTAIIAEIATKDLRIRVVNQPHQGKNTARNTGINNAKFNWLLFLDPGDLILPSHLERITNILAKSPKLDVAYCGWVRITPDGKPYGLPECLNVSGDLFDLLARNNPFAIHGCIVKRSQVEAVGKFDSTLENHADWDLWQRIARTGAYFGGTQEILAFDRIGFNSESATPLSMFTDAMRLVKRGHSGDSRVSNPHPSHQEGIGAANLPVAELILASTYAGLAIGAGEDFRPIVAQLQDEYGQEALSFDLIKSFLYALPLPTCHPLNEYDRLWQTLEQPINEFATALGERLRVAAFARRAILYMERAILEQAVVERRPIALGSMYAVKIELTQSIPDFYPPSPTERLHCTVVLAGEQIGFLELPVFDGMVASSVVASAIATEFGEVISKHTSENQLHSLKRFLKPERLPSRASDRQDAEAFQLPILMYHQVAPTGASKFARWRVTPEAFEEQLRFLQDIGAYSVTLEEWQTAYETKTPLPGKPVLITFDDGYRDFITYAWSLLKRYGFGATMFIVADFVGKSNSWDKVYYGEDLTLLDWKDIKQLHNEGLEIGSHSLSHRPLTSISPTEVLREASQSRTIIERELGVPIKAFAYPYGDLDPVVRHIIGTSGYDLGISCIPRHSSFQDSRLQLSRIEVGGTESLEEFKAKVFPHRQVVNSH